MAKSILIYRANEIVPPNSAIEASLLVWEPSLGKLLPKGKPFKYIIYSLMALLRIFKNANYSYFTLRKENSVISSFLVVPPHYRWPFMFINDVQFTYVMTNKEFRGKGMAWQGLFEAAVLLKKKGVNAFWYVTESDNIASQRLAEKMGFELFSKGRIKRKLGGLIKVLILTNDK